jgi:hypothetical protein
LRFCLYARKSSVADDWQVLSMDSQAKEMLALAERGKWVNPPFSLPQRNTSLKEYIPYSAYYLYVKVWLCKKNTFTTIVVGCLVLTFFISATPKALAQTPSQNSALIAQLQLLLQDLLKQLAVLSEQKTATPQQNKPASISTQSPSCVVTTDKKRYQIKENVTFSWNAPGAKFVLFSSNNGGKDGLQLPEGIFEQTKGSTSVKTNFTGTDKITLEVHTAYGKPPVATCTTTVIVDKIKRSFGSNDVASIIKEMEDPVPGSIGDEYESYTLTLKSGDTFTMAIFQEQYADRGSIFKANGYTGNVDTLLKLID